MGAIVYCNDDGSNTSPYDTWAKAATTMATALGAVDAGGTIYVQSNHVEQFSADTTLKSTNGTAANPVTIVSVTNLNEPPVAGDYETMTTGGGNLDAKTNGVYDIILDGWDIWVGLEFITGDDFFGVITADTECILIDCKILTDSWIYIGIQYGQNEDSSVYFENVDIVFEGSGSIQLSQGLSWKGGTFSLGVGGSVVTNLFTPYGVFSGWVVIEDITITGPDSGDYIFASSNTVEDLLMKRCKIPAAMNYMNSGPTGRGQKARFHSVDDSDNIHTFKEYYFEGRIESDTAVYLDATYDGTNGYSAKMVADKANTKAWTRPLRFKLADIYITATGKTITVETLTDNVTLQNDEFWIEIEYPDSTTGALGNIFSTKPATILTAPSNLTASSKGASDWTGESGTPVYQKVTADFTGVADEAIGVYTVWACLAKETTVYVDPKIVVA